MRRESFQRLSHTRQYFKKLLAVAGHSSRFFRQTRNEHLRARQNLVLTDTFSLNAS